MAAVSNKVDSEGCVRDELDAGLGAELDAGLMDAPWPEFPASNF